VRVFSNLAISLDGKISDLRAPSKLLGTPDDRVMMDILRAQADVVLTGSTTLKAHPHTYRLRGKKYAKKRQPANAILTASGDLDKNWKFWSDPEVVRFIFTTARGFKKASMAAQERAFVVVAGEVDIDLSQVLSRLKASGLENVLVEGGGQTMASFLDANLLQELYVTLTPWILGGQSNPTLVAGENSLMPWKSLKLVKSKKLKDEIYLHYKVKGSRRV
jgi:5-amino-6-(5-phosphoribosylamino)uracil reductase